MYFKYGETETEYLKSKDKKLCKVIDKIGHINRIVEINLFSAVIHNIIGQQISTKALETIWKRFYEKYKDINANKIFQTDVNELQSIGISFRKAEYIKDFVQKVKNNEFNLKEIEKMNDEDAIKALTSLKGIGVWTAEMILLFCLQRPNIFSFNDIGIQRGLRMVYHHKKISKKLFEKYRKRFSPYCSVACLYLWEVSGGAIPDMKDYTPKI